MTRAPRSPLPRPYAVPKRERADSARTQGIRAQMAVPNARAFRSARPRDTYDIAVIGAVPCFVGAAVGIALHQTSLAMTGLICGSAVALGAMVLGR